MGLFDVFKSEPLKLSPRLALAVGLLYMMAADGEIESEEIGQLQSVVGGDQELINTAVKYLRSVKYEQFLTDAAALLNERQKLCLLINMADSLLSDGRAEQSEQQAFGKKRAALGVQLSSFITQIMNDEQRKYASGRVETWALDVQELIKESSVLAAKRSALPNR